MYANRHSGPPNPPQGPPMNQGQFGSVPPNSSNAVRDFCDKINKEHEALQLANHSLRMDIEKINNEKTEMSRMYIMASDMAYALQIDINRQKEISKRLNNIIINLMPYVSSDQQAQIASSVDRAKQFSQEELNSMVEQNLRDNYSAPELHPSMGGGGMPGIGRLMPGTPGLPGLPGMPPHGPFPPLPPNMPNMPNLPPHALPPHGPPLHGLPPQSMMQPGLNISSPPNPTGLLAMSSASGLPGMGVPGVHGGMIPPGPGRSNPLPPMEPNNNNNNNINNNNHGKRNSIDNDRKLASGSNEIASKKSRKQDHESSHANQHQVMMNNSSSLSDDEKSEDLVVDGNDDRITSPNSHHNGSTSPRENGASSEWNEKQIKKERPLSRASSVNSGPSGRERSSPKTSAHKPKSSPNSAPDPMSSMSSGAMTMMPGMPGYGRSVFPMGPLGSDGMPIPMGPGGVKIPLGPLPEPYSIQLDPEGRPKLIPCSPRMLADPSVPKKAREVFTLEHGEVVCAVALSNPTRNIYTGGKSLVKVWSLDNSDSNSELRTTKTLYNPVAELNCLPSNSYVRACKLLPDGKKLIVGGEVPPISVWDLSSSGPVKLGELRELAPACYALAISPDSKTCITCFSDGTIGLYDIHNLSLIGKFQGHADGASCIDISSDGNTFWTGGLDMSLKSWNLNAGCCPSGDYIAVGMENSIIDVMSTSNKSENKQLKMHDSCVLALKFAASGKWFISTGKDKLLNLCGSPAINCPQIMKFQENSSVLSCDISRDDKYFATGSGDKKATVYEVLY